MIGINTSELPSLAGVRYVASRIPHPRGLSLSSDVIRQNSPIAYLPDLRSCARDKSHIVSQLSHQGADCKTTDSAGFSPQNDRRCSVVWLPIRGSQTTRAHGGVPFLLACLYLGRDVASRDCLAQLRRSIISLRSAETAERRRLELHRHS